MSEKDKGLSKETIAEIRENVTKAHSNKYSWRDWEILGGAFMAVGNALLFLLAAALLVKAVREWIAASLLALIGGVLTSIGFYCWIRAKRKVPYQSYLSTLPKVVLLTPWVVLGVVALFHFLLW